jgi:hypothetical protein
MDSVWLMATLVGDSLYVMQGAGEIWYIYVNFFCVIFSLGILLLDIVVSLFIFHLFLSNGISWLRIDYLFSLYIGKNRLKKKR